MWKGRSMIDEAPHAGHRSRSARDKTFRIDCRSAPTSRLSFYGNQKKSTVWVFEQFLKIHQPVQVVDTLGLQLNPRAGGRNNTCPCPITVGWPPTVMLPGTLRAGFSPHQRSDRFKPDTHSLLVGQARENMGDVKGLF